MHSGCNVSVYHPFLSVRISVSLVIGETALRFWGRQQGLLGPSYASSDTIHGQDSPSRLPHTYGNRNPVYLSHHQLIMGQGLFLNIEELDEKFIEGICHCNSIDMPLLPSA